MKEKNTAKIIIFNNKYDDDFNKNGSSFKYLLREMRYENGMSQRKGEKNTIQNFDTKQLTGKYLKMKKYHNRNLLKVNIGEKKISNR